ncbi:unnamed protein product [Rotaria sordida]|uniref:Uncharacterized protein n=1 Tax=Rotaria sordida TaxID=392033 RepID=A0A816DMM3_9BILA|nr:unnamed protein product [Rotaria sordida]CAF1634923.1 unnamed protein product [Rotaria sordida]
MKGARSLFVQESQNQTTVSLGLISRLVLVISPSLCRLQSVCEIQPVLVDIDTSGNIIQKLGSNDQLWQVVASIIGSSGISVIGVIANYSNGQTQFTSFAAVSLYTLLQYQSTGSLITTSSSRIIVDPMEDTITAINLAINYSNYILVKENSTVLEVYTDFLPSNLTYEGDCDSLVANDQLEPLRCTIYNDLVFITKMPVSSDIVLRKGCIQVGLTFAANTISAAQNIANGALMLLANPNAIAGVRFASVNVNGQSYVVSSRSSFDSSDGGSDIGLIVGPVMGLIGGTIVIVGLVFVSPFSNQPEETSEHRANAPKSVNDATHPIRRASVTLQTVSNFDDNQLHSPLSNDKHERVPLAAISINMINHMSPNSQEFSCNSLPPVEFIRFD